MSNTHISPGVRIARTEGAAISFPMAGVWICAAIAVFLFLGFVFNGSFIALLIASFFYLAMQTGLEELRKWQTRYQSYLCEFTSEGEDCDDCGDAIEPLSPVFFISDGGFEPRDGTHVCQKCIDRHIDGIGFPEIKTNHVLPPIPVRQFDWTAWYDGQDEGPFGWGASEEDAINDLVDNYSPRTFQ